jgi:hypothetical protein
VRMPTRTSRRGSARRRPNGRSEVKRTRRGRGKHSTKNTCSGWGPTCPFMCSYWISQSGTWCPVLWHCALLPPHPTTKTHSYRYATIFCRFSGEDVRTSMSYHHKAGDGVYLMEVFTPEFCDLLQQEVENFEHWCTKENVKILRPNSMNNYGVRTTSHNAVVFRILLVRMCTGSARSYPWLFSGAAAVRCSPHRAAVSSDVSLPSPSRINRPPTTTLLVRFTSRVWDSPLPPNLLLGTPLPKILGLQVRCGIRDEQGHQARLARG